MCIYFLPYMGLLVLLKEFYNLYPIHARWLIYLYTPQSEYVSSLVSDQFLMTKKFFIKPSCLIILKLAFKVYLSVYMDVVLCMINVWYHIFIHQTFVFDYIEAGVQRICYLCVMVFTRSHHCKIVNLVKCGSIGAIFMKMCDDAYLIYGLTPLEDFDVALWNCFIKHRSNFRRSLKWGENWYYPA